MGLFFFGPSSRQLFGVYEPAPASSRRGVVLCNPWGQEYLRAHQSMRVLGRLLGTAGFHVLRFDWYGTGDSGGSALDGGEPEAWLTDLGWSIEELRETAQLDRVTLVGLRLGATVAAMASRTRSDVDRLVLWDPVADGGAYLEEISSPGNVIRPQAYRDLETSQGGEVVGVHGYPLTPKMRRNIGAITAQDFAAPLPPTLLISTVEDPERYGPLRLRLAEQGVELSDRVMEGPMPWVEEGDFGTAGMPVAALREIAGWLT